VFELGAKDGCAMRKVFCFYLRGINRTFARHYKNVMTPGYQNVSETVKIFLDVFNAEATRAAP